MELAYHERGGAGAFAMIIAGHQGKADRVCLAVILGKNLDFLRTVLKVRKLEL